MQLKHQEELGKRLKMNINTEKKLIKEVSQVKPHIVVVFAIVFTVLWLLLSLLCQCCLCCYRCSKYQHREEIYQRGLAGKKTNCHHCCNCVSHQHREEIDQRDVTDSSSFVCLLPKLRWTELCVERVQRMLLHQGHETERKSFETKMKAEYKLKKERWKREMESQETPKSQRNQGEKFFQPPTQSSVTLALAFFQGLDFLCLSVLFLPSSSSSYFSVAFLSKQKLTYPSRFQLDLSWPSH